MRGLCAAGDSYLPKLKLPHKQAPIGRYGRMHREALKVSDRMPWVRATNRSTSFLTKYLVLIIRALDAANILIEKNPHLC